MTAPELFEALAPLVAPACEEEFVRRDPCVFATRVAVEVAHCYGIEEAGPLPVKVPYNAPFAHHLASLPRRPGESRRMPMKKEKPAISVRA